MLVLTRKKAESIQIGEDIIIKVLQTGRNTVKIGIDAPATVRVLRAELCDPDSGRHPLAVFLKGRPGPARTLPVQTVPAPTLAPRPIVPIRPR